MCNIAGYTGSRQAVSVLIEMIRRQEGFSGGYFTGLATIEKEKLLFVKRCGDLEYLLENTNAAQLAGNVGIMHSRSEGSGGDIFAHPFLDALSDEPTVAYVANGIGGRSAEAGEIAQRLFDQGYRMPQESGIDGYLKLKNGGTVHISDVMCQLITCHVKEGMPTEQAMLAGFTEMPAQIVGLAINTAEEGKISFARYNFPMFAGFDESGCYLSSTPLAFPECVGRIIPIPPMSYGFVLPQSVTIFPMPAPALTVSVCDGFEQAQICGALTEALQNERSTFGRLASVVRNKMRDGDCDCKDCYQLAHEMLYSLWRKGNVRLSEVRLPGVRPYYTAPQTLFEWKETE